MYLKQFLQFIGSEIRGPKAERRVQDSRDDHLDDHLAELNVFHNLASAVATNECSEKPEIYAELSLISDRFYVSRVHV